MTVMIALAAISFGSVYAQTGNPGKSVSDTTKKTVKTDTTKKKSPEAIKQ